MERKKVLVERLQSISAKKTGDWSLCDILGYARPESQIIALDHLPEGLQLRLRDALDEIELTLRTRAIQPDSEEDIKLIFASLSKTKPYYTAGRREAQNTLHFADRSRAMILLMLDTGVRVSELCDLKVKDVDLRNKQVTVFGKGSKERSIPISPRTAQSLWRYFTSKPDQLVFMPAFSTDQGLKLDRANVLKQCKRIGERAGVQDCHPHRFRHTFAIQYLRNGGDIYTLQKILGHSTLDMVKRYLMIAQTDLTAAHRVASPVTRWGL